MKKRSEPARRWRRTTVAAGFIAVGMLGAGCSAPNPNTPAGEAEIAGQKCNVCVVENPGDPAACYAICMQRVEDQATYMKAYHH